VAGCAVSSLTTMLSVSFVAGFWHPVSRRTSRQKAVIFLSVFLIVVFLVVFASGFKQFPSILVSPGSRSLL
jgi:hypothetical protein